jgi:CRISPR system Cascade subunit CasE
MYHTYLKPALDNLDAHRKVRGIFPTINPRFRINENHIIVRSEILPDTTNFRFDGKWVVDPIQLQKNKIYSYTMRCNPTEWKNGKNKSPLLNYNEIIKWVHRKEQVHGFKLFKTTLKIEPTTRFFEDGVHRIYNSINIEGLLKITDTDLFEGAYKNGVGTAKTYGFGLIILQ